MPDQPRSASDYTGAQADLVRATCLYVATMLGDLMGDLVVVGGLVPSLLIDQNARSNGTDAHVGTMDLDIGLALALLEAGRYKTLTERLRVAGFQMDSNDAGRATRQRWKITSVATVTVDFLIPPLTGADQGGSLRNIEADFAAIIVPGLQLAFRDRQRVRLDGLTVLGEKATREISICGPGAFVVLKALAFDGRGAGKDAYDLFYVLRNYGSGVTDVAARLRPLLGDADAQAALAILRRDFRDPESLGPKRVAAFMGSAADEGVRADVVGFVLRLLAECEQ